MLRAAVPLPSPPPPATQPAPSASSRATWIVAVVLVSCVWAVLRLAMTREYGPASWSALVELRAPLPFGHRVLIPLLARPFVHAGAPVAWVFGVSEALATIALLLTLAAALRDDLPLRAARLGAVLVLPVLSLPLLLAHRWPIFYPWDAWAMVAIVLGTHALRRGRTVLAFAVVILGALNRESVVLVPLVGAILRLDRESLRTNLARTVLLLFAYVGARAVLPWLAPEARGAALHVMLGDELRLHHNLRWLAEPANIAQWWGSVAMLPLAWFAVRRVAPRDLVRMHAPLLVALCGLLVVANAYEPRVYAELMAIAWWVVWAGAWTWASERPPAPVATDAGVWLRMYDRWAVAVVIAVAAVIAVAWL